MLRLTAILLPALALTLGACATPREACIAQAQSSLRDVTRDIARVQRDLDRGFRLVTVRDTELALTQCVRTDRAGDEVTFPCQKPVTVRRSEPVSIDFAEERARLRALQARRATLERQVPDRIRACQATYPAES